MKARKRDSNDNWRNIAYVQLEDSYCLTSADQMEFQQDTLSTELKTCNQVNEEKHWQGVRERAAIAVLNSIITIVDNDYKSDFKQIAEYAIACADALVKQLKEE